MTDSKGLILLLTTPAATPMLAHHLTTANYHTNTLTYLPEWQKNKLDTLKHVLAETKMDSSPKAVVFELNLTVGMEDEVTEQFIALLKEEQLPVTMITDFATTLWSRRIREEIVPERLQEMLSTDPTISIVSRINNLLYPPGIGETGAGVIPK